MVLWISIDTLSNTLMDWKYKHFHQERVFQASRDDVLEAARKYVSETLLWEIQDVADGFTAEGYCFHRGMATVRFQTVAGGTRIEIELLVRRASSTGFMLFDVGGYYNIQIRHWFDGIQWIIHQKLAGADEKAPPPMPQANQAAAAIFSGCIFFIVAMFALWFIVNFICAIIGLITGTLYLFGRGGTITLHGVAARIVSALIISFVLFIAWRIRHVRHPSRTR
ncbi:MAG TPA: hypothetical protein VE863_00370 [Pyrinomonadaceae bacterium]|jgi:hypothetical protein|nr:hypothetical protein [Pyrinomonadaceae bacterium]